MCDKGQAPRSQVGCALAGCGAFGPCLLAGPGKGVHSQVGLKSLAKAFPQESKEVLGAPADLEPSRVPGSRVHVWQPSLCEHPQQPQETVKEGNGSGRGKGLAQGHTAGGRSWEGKPVLPDSQVHTPACSGLPARTKVKKWLAAGAPEVGEPSPPPSGARTCDTCSAKHRGDTQKMGP